MTEVYGQPQLTWWDKDDDSKIPSVEVRKWYCDPKQNADNPFANYIGNEDAVRRLCRAAFAAFGRYNHECSDQSFALLGPASTGKTTLAKMFADFVKLPYVEISPQSCTCITDVAFQIMQTCQNFIAADGGNLELVECATLHGKPVPAGTFEIPPIVVFIDEVHQLTKKVEQGLLKALEKNDSMMVTENGFTFDTRRVCRIIATTDRGALFDAFDTRFTKIQLNLYSFDEMAEIIQIHNPDWDYEVCELVAHFAGRVPREALSFAREMRLEYDMNRRSWDDVAACVAKDNGIDEYGMTFQRLAIIKALGQGPISKSRLCSIVNCKEAELLKFIVPPLLASLADQQPLITVTSKGFELTRAGAAELDKRSIPYAPELFVKKTTLANRLTRNNLN